MAFGQSFADIKKSARRAVHTAFAVPIVYYLRGTTSPAAVEIPLTARFQDKIIVEQDPLGATAGFSTMLTQVARVVFNREQLAGAGISPANGDYVVFPDYDLTATLDVRDPPNGPIDDKWSVSLA
jgi:hypothetical protein